MRLQNEMYVVTNETAEQVEIRLIAAHYIYQAHFPGNPITPGVCIVQMIGELLEQRTCRQLSLSRVVNLKFVSALTPTNTPEVTVKFASVQTDDNECKAKGVLEAKGEILTKFSLVFKVKE